MQDFALRKRRRGWKEGEKQEDERKFDERRIKIEEKRRPDQK